MGLNAIESVSYRVPLGEGYIIGDTLRKFATRSVHSWQVIGYRVGTSSPNFGFSNGTSVSYLELIRGQLLCNGTAEADHPREVQLIWDGSCYSNSEFRLINVPHAIGESIVVLVDYASGYRSAEQNFDVVRNTVSDPDSYFAVPSAHSAVGTFKYNVTSEDLKTEWLEIQADKGVLASAIQSAVASLSRLAE